MPQHSKRERKCSGDDTGRLKVFRRRGPRNCHQRAYTRMTRSSAGWTVVLVFVIGVCFVGTVSAIDVYPNNEGRCCTIVTRLCCFRRVMFKTSCSIKRKVYLIISKQIIGHLLKQLHTSSGYSSSG